MGVDFVGSDGTNQGDGKNRSDYDIEYTKPQSEQEHATQPVAKGSFLDRFRKVPAPKKTPAANMGQTVGTAPKANLSTNFTPSQPPVSAPEVKSYGVVEHATASVSSVQQPQSLPSAPNPSAPTAQSITPALPQAAIKKTHIIPPPPPPPLHGSHKEAKVMSTTPISVIPPAAKPVAPQPALQPAVTPVAPQPQPQPMPRPVLTGAPLARPSMAGAPALAPTPAPTVAPSLPSAPVPPVVPATSPAVSGAPRQNNNNMAHAPARETNGNGAVIVAQNVSNIKGQMTQPQAIVAGGLNVNLIPQYGTNGMTGETGLVRLLRVGTVTMWLLSLVYAGMVGYQAYVIYRNEQVQQELTQLNTEIASYHSLQTTLNETNTTLTAIQDLLHHHIYWTNWFAFLEKYTAPNVYYTEFSGSTTGSMNLAAVTDNYTSITQQINAFESSPLVESVDVNTATRTNTTVAENSTSADATITDATTPATPQGGLIHFTLTVTVKPELFYYQAVSYDPANATN